MRKHYLLATAAIAVLPLAAPAFADYYDRDGRLVREAPRYEEPRAAPYARVVAIERVGEGHHTSGAGAVLGGIAGGVLGHQIGSGRGNDAATVAGAIGGAVVGNNIEKNRNEREHWNVTVRYRGGREETLAMDDLEGIRVGDRVRVDGGRIFRG